MAKITLKDDRVFMVCDEAGDVINNGEGYGLYLNDMRFLSLWELKLNGEKPVSLSHNVEYNYAATFQLSNQYFKFATETLAANSDEDEDEPKFTLSNLLPNATHSIAANTINVARRRIIKNGLRDTIEFNNFYPQPLQIEVALKIAGDFKDIFEIRGFPRTKYAAYPEPHPDDAGKSWTLAATGLDEQTRTLKISFSKRPTRTELGEIEQFPSQTKVPCITAYFLMKLPPFTTVSFLMEAVPQPPDNTSTLLAEPVLSFKHEVEMARQKFNAWQNQCCDIQTERYQLDRLLRVSLLDMRSLMQQVPQGLAITAGIPWYFTLFGRDSLITAMQSLMLNPQVAVDTLRVLAAYQGTKWDDWRDEEPGKILHELRVGEMVRTGELPHSPYYGTVDATPLFILLFAKTVKWLGDEALYHELWPNVERALNWVAQYSNIDGDGYVKFARRSSMGILHQGWKDSDESMGGQLGPRPSQPLALVEVQGYAYDAKIQLADVVELYGDPQMAQRLRGEAQKLKTQFNRDFWWPEEGFVFQALDGNKQPVKHVTSNAGHSLWSGILDEDKAQQVAARLSRPDMLDGWGLRTLSANDETYNPMSYHNGSIWPHDNSLAVAGLARYGFAEAANVFAGQIFDAGLTFPDYRLPELYCGFDADEKTQNAPSAYPVSCQPQAWAAATPFLLMQSILGLSVDGAAQTVNVAPHLPAWLERVRLNNLKVGQARLDLLFRRDPANGQTSVEVLNNPDGVTVQTDFA